MACFKHECMNRKKSLFLIEFTKLFCFYTMATQVMHARVYSVKKMP